MAKKTKPTAPVKVRSKTSPEPVPVSSEEAYAAYRKKEEKLWVRYTKERESIDRNDPACVQYFADEAVVYLEMMTKCGYGTANDKRAVKELLNAAAKRITREPGKEDLPVKFGMAEERYQKDREEHFRTAQDLETLLRQAHRLLRYSTQLAERIATLRELDDVPGPVWKAAQKAIKACRKVVVEIDREV